VFYKAKNILIMKRVILSLIAVVFFNGFNFGQNVSKVIDISELDKNSTIEYKTNVASFYLDVMNSEKGATFTPRIKGYEKVKIELYGYENKLLGSYYDYASSGPNAYNYFNYSPEFPIGTQILEKNDVWPIVIAIALCCVEASIGSDGWSVGFDCDCLEGASLKTNNKESINDLPDLTIRGKLYKDVLRINFIPLGKNDKPIFLDNKQLEIIKY
jgi:hypothetical protein